MATASTQLRERWARLSAPAVILIVIAALWTTGGTSAAVVVGSLQVTSGPAVLHQPVTVTGFHPDCAPYYNWDMVAGDFTVAFSTNTSSAGEISITFAPQYLGTWTATARCRNYSELTVTFEVLATAPPSLEPAPPTTTPMVAQPPATALPDAVTATEPPPSDQTAIDGVFPRYVG